MTHQQVIDLLGLSPLPGEGGFFRETYRSEQTVNVPGLGKRALSTAIYYSLSGDDFSAFHRLPGDEIYTFHSGAGLRVYQLKPGGGLVEVTLGERMHAGEFFQYRVPAGSWQALESLGDWSLVSTIVTPGFEFDDLELARAEELAQHFPEHERLIQRFSRR